MKNYNENRNAEPENELNQKHIFTDLHTKPNAPVLIEKYDDLPEPAFDKKSILDEAYAERKQQRETAERKPRMALPEMRIPTPRPIPRRKPIRSKTQRFRTEAFKDIRLYSGEMTSDAALRILRELGALVLFCLLVAIVISAKGFVLNYMTNDDYSSLSRSTTYSAAVAVENVAWTSAELPDGLAAAQAACTMMGSPIANENLTSKKSDVLLNPTVVASKMESALTADHVELKTNMSNLDLVLQIYKSLETGKPVIVLFSDRTNSTVRYGIVTHMDAENDVINLQTADRDVHTMTFEQFIAATRFDNTDDVPFQVRAGLMIGAWARNTAIFVK